MTNDPAHLPNWTGLLNWSTKYHDGTSASSFEPMNGERRSWLEKALHSAFDGQEDPNNVIKKGAEEILAGRVSAGLDMLDYTSDFLDCADNIELLGALGPLISVLDSEDPHAVKRALEVLTMYLPNNPRIQIAAQVKHNSFDRIRQAVNRHMHDRIVVQLSMAVLGSLIRNVGTLEASFVREGGVEYLLDVFSGYMEDTRVIQKIVGTLSTLIEGRDLSRYFTDFVARLTAIYISGAYPKDDIQFWEVMAIFAIKLRTLTGSPIPTEVRLCWISSLTDTDQDEYRTELEILRNFTE